MDAAKAVAAKAISRKSRPNETERHRWQRKMPNAEKEKGRVKGWFKKLKRKLKWKKTKAKAKRKT